MAEPTQSPALPSTADATPYVPIAWSAVAAFAVATLYAVLLTVLGISAFVNKKPLLIEELLVLPVIAVVLSFAARRMIRNSEGTRTGEALADWAWWIALVSGLAYFAYLIAISFAVRREAAVQVEQWIGLVQKGEPEDAFYLTIPPGGRQGIARSDKQAIRGRFGDELLAFKGTDLMKLAQRNGGEGEFKFTSGGVADWSYKPGTIDCTYNGQVTCPEGRFPVLIALKGTEGVTGGDGGRQWMIVRPQGGGFIRQDKAERTAYGWLLVVMEVNGGGFAREFLTTVGAGPGAHPYAYQLFIRPGTNVRMWQELVVTTPARTAAAGGLGTAVAMDGGYGEYMNTRFFSAPGGAEAKPINRERFLSAWTAFGVFEAGRRLKDASGGVADKESILKVTDTAVELHVPLEIPLPSVNKMETARGRLVVATKDPTLLEELKKRKAAAIAGEKPSTSPPPDLEQWAAINWRVVRIESDLAPVNVGPSPGGQGGPGGGPPGMPGGH